MNARALGYDTAVDEALLKPVEKHFRASPANKIYRWVNRSPTTRCIPCTKCPAA